MGTERDSSPEALTRRLVDHAISMYVNAAEGGVKDGCRAKLKGLALPPECLDSLRDCDPAALNVRLDAAMAVERPCLDTMAVHQFLWHLLLTAGRTDRSA